MAEEILIIQSNSALMQQAFDLRHAVFVVEQGVPVDLEIDEYDADAVHLLVQQDGEVVATLRLVRYADHIKIGRVAVMLSRRRKGIGSRLMLRAIEYMTASGFRTAKLDAQVSSMPFYRGLGFIEQGEVFDDAGMLHMRMTLSLH